MKNAEGLIINNPVEFEFSGGGSLSPGLCASREYRVKINWMGNDNYDFFPNDQDLYYYPEVGKIVFTLGDEVFGVLYKDHVISDLGDSMPKGVECMSSEEI